MIRRLLILPFLLVLVALIAFLYPYMSGFDPTSSILRSRIGEREQTPEIVAAIREELGLDQPLPYQFVFWLRDLIRGNLGNSFVSQAVGEIFFVA
jgi:ABC-type dipeptide/oligopeptide/nickel transport system permease component